MRIFKLQAEGYIDPFTEFEFKHIMTYREAFPLLHTHDFYELLLIVDGSIRHFVNDEIQELKKGHLVFIRPSDYHYFHFRKGDCHFINLAILEQTIEELFSYLGKGFNRATLLDPALPPTLLLTSNELGLLLNQFENLNTLPVDNKVWLNIELRCILIGIFSRFFLTRPRPDDRFPEWLSRVVTKMNHPSKFKEGNSAIRELACKSDEHISRSFKRYLNKTPRQFVNELRLNYAANQIRFSERNIHDIAFESGFENQSNFHRQFKRMFNITPSAFRKANQNLNQLNEMEEDQISTGNPST